MVVGNATAKKIKNNKTQPVGIMLYMLTIPAEFDLFRAQPPTVKRFIVHNIIQQCNYCNNVKPPSLNTPGSVARVQQQLTD